MVGNNGIFYIISKRGDRVRGVFDFGLNDGNGSRVGNVEQA